jgi:hypothetical protein
MTLERRMPGGLRRNYRGGGPPASWSPTAFGASLGGWWRADRYAAGTWTDLSALAQNPVQATGSLQATLTTRYGQPACSFDGGDFSQGALTGSRSQPFTRWAVVEPATSIGTRTIVDGDDGSNNPSIQTVVTPAWRIYAGTNVNAGTPVVGTPYLLIAIYDATGLLYVNDLRTGQHVISGAEGARTMDGITIGAASGGGAGWIGFISEVGIYLGAMSAADRALLGGYVLARYPGGPAVVT